MDLTSYREQLAKGETIDFFVSKRAIKISFFAALLILVASCVIVISERNIIALCVWIFAVFYIGRFLLALGKFLSTRSYPKIVLSLDKESLTIYDLSIPALLGKDEPRVSILWTDILRLGIDNGGKETVIVLQCIPPAIQNVKQHEQQVSGKLLRTYTVSGDLIVLNLSSWIEMSLTDMEVLLQDVHQSATANQQ